MAHVAASPSPGPDFSLYAMWCAGDSRAGDQLLRRLSPLLQQFFSTKVRPEDVDDMVQQVWVELSVASKRGVEIRATVRSYVLGIARHILCRYLRARYEGEVVDIDPLRSSIANLDPSLSTVIGERLAAQRMMLALQRLPVDTQILLELRYVSGLTTVELAAMYEIPVGTIKSRLAHARVALEKEVDGRW